MNSAEQKDIEAIKHLTVQWLSAEKAKDIHRLLTMVTDDIVFLPPNAQPIKGKSAVEALYRSVFAQFAIEHAAATDEVKIAGDWAFSWGREVLNLTPLAGGREVQLKGHGMSILRRQTDGSWNFAARD
jgi:uncharacterized protein (TIGR02246 family)